jgi:dihydroxyacid dehydratase/phosphogluconate dehydratase
LYTNTRTPRSNAACSPYQPAAYLRPRQAFENAVRLVMVTGGSTNATIHLIAMARAAGVDLTLEDFKRISAEVGR